MPYIDQFFQVLIDSGASDLHLAEGQSPKIRRHGEIVPIREEPLTQEEMSYMLSEICTPERWQRFEENGDLDFAYEMNEDNRFRCNYLKQTHGYGAVFRIIPTKIKTLEDLRVPEIIKTFGHMRGGIVLVTGPTGSGKSSTLAAMLRHLNETEALHVITLEDPVEYLFSDRKCSFSQREVGIDVADFPAGLKAALRQDPDVILVGEMRDRETFETAVHASETGHLVLSTLHAGSAQQAVQRLFEFYPPEQLNLARRAIASVLRAVVVQTLVPRADGAGVLPACEVFVVDPLARRMLADGSFERIPELVEAGGDVGSRSLNKDLTRLIRAGLVTKETGLRVSANPKGLEMNLAGISFAGSRIVS